MSFSADVDLEAQIPYSDAPEFDALAETVSSGLFEINSSLVKLESFLKALEKKGSVQTEEKAVELADHTRQKFKAHGDDMRRLQTWPDALPAHRFTQEKLSREFSTALSEFQDLQRRLAERQRLSIIQAKSNIASSKHNQNLIDEAEYHRHEEHDDELHGGFQTQTQETLRQGDVEYQQALILERENEIQGIEQGIEELNEIFTDLSTIVTEQGTIIDNIEANIYNVAQSTRDASTQLTKAARYQRNSRGRALCLLIILIVVLAVILLAIFLG
ncbi:syntaxin Pep12p [Trichomonascus vanleenenianus]|uniref:syntaxin Pep12p n=1 Tax=Trichomonascus vanleenenianus TaxID=2268995 RepID=UPI003ECB0DD5